IPFNVWDNPDSDARAVGPTDHGGVRIGAIGNGAQHVNGMTHHSAYLSIKKIEQGRLGLSHLFGCEKMAEADLSVKPVAMGGVEVEAMRPRNWNRPWARVAVFVLVLALTGCTFAVGGRGRVSPPSRGAGGLPGSPPPSAPS